MSISRHILIDILCDLHREKRREDVLPVLKKLGLTMTAARSLIATENPRVGTAEYVRALYAKEIMLFADMYACKAQRVVIEAVPTPPQTERK